MTGYVAVYRVDPSLNRNGPGVEVIELPVIMVKRYGDDEPVACALGAHGQVSRADSLCTYAGQQIKFMTIRPA